MKNQKQEIFYSSRYSQSQDPQIKFPKDKTPQMSQKVILPKIPNRNQKEREKSNGRQSHTLTNATIDEHSVPKKPTKVKNGGNVAPLDRAGSRQTRNREIKQSGKEFDDILMGQKVIHEQTMKSNKMLQKLIKQQTSHDEIQTSFQNKIPDKQQSHNCSFKDKPLKIIIQKQFCFPEVYERGNIHEVLSKWTSKIFNDLSDSSFYGYQQTKLLSYGQTKSYFSRNLVLNWIKMMNYLKTQYFLFWKRENNWIINQCSELSKKALGFLKLKYPQRKKEFLNQKLYNFIQNKEMSYEIKKFILKQYKFQNKQFTWKTIKQLMNKIIEQTNARNIYFKEQLKQLFQLKNGTYIDHKIGTKLLVNTPAYTKEQMELQGMSLKNPQMLRIVTKFIESLQSVLQKMIDCAEFQSDQKKRKLLKIRDEGSLLKLMEFQRINLAALSEQSLEIMEKLKVEFSFISQADVKCSILTSILSESIESFLCQYLYFLLTSIESIDKSELIFELFDLFRAKCSGTLEEIKSVYEKIQKKNDIFEIVRVKNRLNTQNRDFLLNIKFITSQKQKQQHSSYEFSEATSSKESVPFPSYIFELQLCIVSTEESQKQEYYNHFNHFLYQLERSRYGPYFEAISIMSASENYVSYFNTSKVNKIIRKNQQKIWDYTVDIIQKNTKRIIASNQYQLMVPNYEIIKQDTDFICSKCNLFIRMYESFFPIAKKSQTQRICGNCIFYNLSLTDQTKYLCKSPQLSGFNLIKPELLKTQWQKIQFFIQIKKNSKRASRCYRLIYDNDRNPYYVSCMSIFSKRKPDNYIINPKTFSFKNSFILQLTNSKIKNQIVDRNGLLFYEKMNSVLSFDNLGLNSQNHSEFFDLMIEKVEKTEQTSLLMRSDQSRHQNEIKTVQSSIKQNNKKQQYILTYFEIQQNSIFLIEFKRSKTDQLIKQEIEKIKIYNQISELQSNKKFQWKLAGPYDQSIFTYIATKNTSCIQCLKCNFFKMKESRSTNIINLKILILECPFPESKIDLDHFNTPNMKQLVLRLNNGDIKNIETNKLLKLEVLKVYQVSPHLDSTAHLNLANLLWFKNLHSLVLNGIKKIYIEHKSGNKQTLATRFESLKKLEISNYKERILNLSDIFPKLEEIRLSHSDIVQIQVQETPKLFLFELNNTKIQQFNLSSFGYQLQNLKLIGNCNLKRLVWLKHSYNLKELTFILNQCENQTFDNNFNKENFKSLKKITCVPKFEIASEIAALLHNLNPSEYKILGIGKSLQQLIFDQQKILAINKEWCNQMIKKQNIISLTASFESVKQKLMSLFRFKQMQDGIGRPYKRNEGNMMMQDTDSEEIEVIQQIEQYSKIENRTQIFKKIKN